MKLYTLEVYITNVPMSQEFIEKNQVVLRIIEIRGDQTLEDLHCAIFNAFDREEEHLYEFQIGGKGPNDPNSTRYSTPDPFESTLKATKSSNDAANKTIDALDLKIDDILGYWFDFRDDWWHQINVVSIKSKAPTGKYPKVIERTGESPPQISE
jgi:hypothetical protein